MEHTCTEHHGRASWDRASQAKTISHELRADAGQEEVKEKGLRTKGPVTRA